ncbi:hypothetical protein P5G65_08030 [Paenibacillus chondroitinus]|uniref:P68 RBP/TagC-like beta-propeller domain-containing protein n=1 Tax=Paenibacillus chondroitinus TaxID=59842 RepID=A0ABU6D7X3_9BACL|nr:MULTISPECIES: Tat pathway signal sequence domain protein [Paenibacillus]MCY9661753.1 hypothetical protein [Paenibacillus anseongense]MEB4793838.1 hypothetical protein [Paenibacillus chondroitinus]
MRAKRCMVLIAGVVLICVLGSSMPTASAKQPSWHSKVFDLSAQPTELVRDKALQNGTVLQSFAFDNVNKHIYTVQLMAGGLMLPGEPAAVSGANRSLNGDLALTELDLEGNKLGYMYLKGFGHGVQIGVETEDGIPYIWSETDSVAEGKDGWGTVITRFKFENGKILTPESPELQKHKLIEGADRTTVNIDAVNDLLTMRYRKDGVFHFGVYELESVKQHQYDAIADVVQPSVGTFQGFASYGQYLYLLEGSSYGTSGSVEPTGNTYITTVNFDTGEAVDKQLITAGSSLSFREPEGLAVRIPDVKHPQKAELGVGFASDFTPLRLANVYTYNRMLPEAAIKNRNK